MDTVLLTIHSSCERWKDATFDWEINNWNLISNAQGKIETKSYNLADSKIACKTILNFSDREISVFPKFKQSQLPQKVSISLILSAKKILILEMKSVIARLIYSCYSFKLPEEHILKEYMIKPFKTLIFRCTINYCCYTLSVRYNVNTEEKRENNVSFNNDNLHYNKLTLRNYGVLYEKQQLCDVTFVTEKGELKAHSVILAMVSPYFLAMFSHKNLKENTHRVVDLTNDTDVTFEIYQGFLDYVYGLKSVFNLSSMVKELLVLADKYDMQELKKACEQYLLCYELNAENLAELLYFSHKYNCKELLEQAIDLAKEDMDIIKKSSEFDNIYQNKDLMLLLL